jgi:hypothetical protein
MQEEYLTFNQYVDFMEGESNIEELNNYVNDLQKTIDEYKKFGKETEIRKFLKTQLKMQINEYNKKWEDIRRIVKVEERLEANKITFLNNRIQIKR